MQLSRGQLDHIMNELDRLDSRNVDNRTLIIENLKEFVEEATALPDTDFALLTYLIEKQGWPDVQTLQTLILMGLFHQAKETPDGSPGE